MKFPSDISEIEKPELEQPKSGKSGSGKRPPMGMDFDWMKELLGEGVDDLLLQELQKRFGGNNGKGSKKGSDGDDVMKCDKKESILSGGMGNDMLDGFKKDDVLMGGEGQDKLMGNNGKDTMTGDAGDDVLDGGNGKDSLYGGSGNDLMDGGRGKDLLVGCEVSVMAGSTAAPEIDTLTGGAGKDTFVLGMKAEGTTPAMVLYSQAGDADYALITDFSRGDLLQLVGTMAEYSLGATSGLLPAGTGIYANKAGQAPELIAVLQGVSDPALSLSSPGFQFVM